MTESTPSSPSLPVADYAGRRRRRSSGRRGPLLPTIWFCVIGVSWMALIIMGLIYLRPRPLMGADYAMGGLGISMGCFYFWVAGAVYRRRRYILEAAFVCAGLGLFSFPVGTIFSVLLLSSLMDRKHDFTK